MIYSPFYLIFFIIDDYMLWIEQAFLSFDLDRLSDITLDNQAHRWWNQALYRILLRSDIGLKSQKDPECYFTWTSKSSFYEISSTIRYARDFQLHRCHQWFRSLSPFSTLSPLSFHLHLYSTSHLSPSPCYPLPFSSVSLTSSFLQVRP